MPEEEPQTNGDRGEGHKTCLDCKARLPLTDFWARKASPDGRAKYCKVCFGLRNAAAYDKRLSRDGATRERGFQPREALPVGLKRCPDCQQVLDVSEFVANRSQKNGIGGYCRPCQNARAKASVLKNHGSARHYHLKHRYGVGADEVLSMLRSQGWLCSICLRGLTEKSAHVDHDHSTGAVRAVLCFNCNGGLGQFGDDARRLRRAASYLEGDVWRPILEAPGVFRLPTSTWTRRRSLTS